MTSRLSGDVDKASSAHNWRRTAARASLKVTWLFRYHFADRTTIVWERFGYIPTDRAFAMPSDKAITANLKPGCADAGIPGTFKAMANELIEQRKKGK